jgi:hypothetical protein
MNAVSGMTALLLPLALGIGCRGVSNPPLDRLGFGARVMRDSVGTVVHAYNSGLGDAELFVIGDTTTWANVWARLNLGVQPPPALPAVDFRTERIVLAALGERRTGGYDIHIDSIVGFRLGSVAYVTSTAPGLTCVTTTALTQPVHLVLFSSPPLTPVAFGQRAVVHSCT